MTFGRKVVSALVVVGVVPVAVIGHQSYRANREELAESAKRVQAQTAAELARAAESHVLRAIEGLQLSVSTLPLATLSRDELADVLRIPYRQLHGLDALALLDEKGDAVVAPVYELDRSGRPPPGRDRVDAESLDTFASKIPFAEAVALGAAIGPPYASPAGSMRVAIAVRAAGGVVAAELSLAELGARFSSLPEEGQRAVLLSAAGERIAGEVPKPVEAFARHPDARAAQLGEEIAAVATVERLGWSVAVARPARIALRGADRVRQYTAYWAAVGLIIALVLGALLARGLSRPVAELRAGAKALTEGRYHKPLEVGSNDELGELSRAFNSMAAEIERRDSEIRQFNAELQARVDERTAELEQAQDQILRTRRLAALGSLGAGVAHELNNPMTALMGLVSLARREVGENSPTGQMLSMGLEQAKRMTKIVAQLRQLTDAEREDAGQRFDLARAARAALGLYDKALREKGIVLETRFDEVPLAQGDPAQIEQVIGALVDNAIAAMPPGGKLKLALSAVQGEALRLDVEDNGRGIPKRLQERIFDPFFTTKTDPAGVGLGLSLSHRIIERHQGKLLVESDEGEGTRFTVLLPAAGEAAHLY